MSDPYDVWTRQVCTWIWCWKQSGAIRSRVNHNICQKIARLIPLDFSGWCNWHHIGGDDKVDKLLDSVGWSMPDEPKDKCTAYKFICSDKALWKWVSHSQDGELPPCPQCLRPMQWKSFPINSYHCPKHGAQQQYCPTYGKQRQYCPTCYGKLCRWCFLKVKRTVWTIYDAEGVEGDDGADEFWAQF
jgi:hypothetical protein